MQKIKREGDHPPLSSFQVGLAVRNITPDLAKLSVPCHPSIRDPIFIRVLVMDDGLSKIVWVTLDIQIMAYTSLMRELIFQNCGLLEEQIIFCPSHTHCVPANQEKSYWEWVSNEVAQATYDALHSLQPAVMDFAKGTSLHNRNRTAMIDGKSGFTSDYLGTPNYLDRLDELFNEVVDRDLAVFSFKSPDGKLIAFFYHYTAHPTILFKNNNAPDISADYPGAIASHLEPKLGCPVFFINGALGDAEPKYPRGEEDLVKMQKGLSSDIISLYSKVQPQTPSLRQTWTWIRWNEKFRWKVGAVQLTHDLAFVHVPCELFNELGMQIKRASPYQHTFISCGRSTNNQDGGQYVPSKRGLEIGAYGAESWRPVEWGELFVQNGHELLVKMRSN